ncbi:nucleotidyltransferase domain-containing protein [Halobacillus yeomjeoni]|uniref:nucleotidyltransferase domain-containing protein n=1 Tax=Halobacillus yeomjeoni TaxID=311194 RepID=UPI001CD49672|nr:nucleotidyltransferase domain-containing protein [Halobacillus yeomjeoni]MCA0983249.1 nucleotidyltransferase domain-containing protein [Halobacillus yeomjeoni]
MRQEIAVDKIVESLKEDPAVRSIFLKGSMGRNEHDSHSDVDLYCLIHEQDKENFLSRRSTHLKAYREIIFYDDIFIIAPQVIAVYDDYLHVDLFTVTEETFQNKDYFTVLYDPENMMEQYITDGKLTLSDTEFKDYVMDIAWFLFQYKKASERGNHLWAAEMLRYTMSSFSNVMLYGYEKDRSRLGLKAVTNHLPLDKVESIKDIYESVNPSSHEKAVMKIAALLNGEMEWIISHNAVDHQTQSFLKRMVGHFENICRGELTNG